MLNRSACEPGQKIIFRLLNRKIPRQSFVLKHEIIPSFQFFTAFIYSSPVFHGVMPAAAQVLPYFPVTTCFLISSADENFKSNFNIRVY